MWRQKEIISMQREKQTIKEINYYCKKLGTTANLVFIRNNCKDLKSLLNDLKELYNIIYDNEK